MKKKISILASLVFFGVLSASAQITGIWQNWDDKTGEPKAHIEVYEEDGKYFGKVIKLLPSATVTHCESCVGDKKGKPLVGMNILWDLEPYEDYYSNGEILDPASGKVYKLNVMPKGDKLDVRGYIGVSLFGRTQTWTRVKESLSAQ